MWTFRFVKSQICLPWKFIFALFRGNCVKSLRRTSTRCDEKSLLNELGQDHLCSRMLWSCYACMVQTLPCRASFAKSQSRRTSSQTESNVFCIMTLDKIYIEIFASTYTHVDISMWTYVSNFFLHHDDTCQSTFTSSSAGCCSSERAPQYLLKVNICQVCSVFLLWWYFKTSTNWRGKGVVSFVDFPEIPLLGGIDVKNKRNSRAPWPGRP